MHVLCLCPSITLCKHTSTSRRFRIDSRLSTFYFAAIQNLSLSGIWKYVNTVANQVSYCSSGQMLTSYSSRASMRCSLGHRLGVRQDKHSLVYGRKNFLRAVCCTVCSLACAFIVLYVWAMVSALSNVHSGLFGFSPTRNLHVCSSLSNSVE